MEEKILPTIKCGDCRHEFICKYTEEMANVRIAVNNIKTTTKSPIIVDVDCKFS